MKVERIGIERINHKYKEVAPRELGKQAPCRIFRCKNNFAGKSVNNIEEEYEFFDF